MTETIRKKSLGRKLLSRLLPLLIILIGLVLLVVIYKLPTEKAEPEILPPIRAKRTWQELNMTIIDLM